MPFLHSSRLLAVFFLLFPLPAFLANSVGCEHDLIATDRSSHAASTTLTRAIYTYMRFFVLQVPEQVPLDGEDPRLIPIVNDLAVAEAGDGYVRVSFSTGPNLARSEYIVSCYESNPDLPTTCGLVRQQLVEPLGSTSGTLPRYGRVDVEVSGLPDDVIVDCFIIAKGSKEKVNKCEFAGTQRTAVPLEPLETAVATRGKSHRDRLPIHQPTWGGQLYLLLPTARKRLPR